MNELSFRLSFVNVPCYCNRIKIIVEKQFCEIYFLAHLEYVNVCECYYHFRYET